MDFQVGQKVVCVIAGQNDRKCGLRVGGIYTISDYGPFFQKLLYDVAEVKTHLPHAWGGCQFRPIVERKTDISVFTRMLTTERLPADLIGECQHG